MSETEAKEAPRRKSRLPLILGIVLVVLANAVVLGRVVLGGKGKAQPEKEEVGAKAALEEFLVNLAGENGGYLKARIVLGLKKGVTEEQLKEEEAPVRDVILRVLTSKDRDEIRTEAGRQKLKQELIRELNEELGGRKVLKIYFTDFATQ